jgi:predicted RNA-binding protein with PUA-like domain
MRSYWLLKTEPDEYSFEQLVTDRRTIWDGVLNNLALIHIRAMKKGDRAFIYHTGKEKAIVGIAEIVSNPYSNPETENEKHLVVDIKPIRKFPYPVNLSEIKSQTQFEGLDLIRNSRLSVMPVKDIWWHAIIGQGGLKTLSHGS